MQTNSVDARLAPVVHPENPIEPAETNKPRWKTCNPGAHPTVRIRLPKPCYSPTAGDELAAAIRAAVKAGVPTDPCVFVGFGAEVRGLEVTASGAKWERDPIAIFMDPMLVDPSAIRTAVVGLVRELLGDGWARELYETADRELRADART